MRLKKGDKVEVMDKKEVPVSWRVAEILSGNGHTYRVRYDSYPGMESHQKVGTVSRKFVRPLIVDESNIRTKEMGHDGKGILFGKSSQGGDDVAASKPSTSYQKMNSQIPQYARAKKQPPMKMLDETPLQESYNYSRSLKRKSTYGSSTNEAHNGHTYKLRGIKVDGKKQRLVAAPGLEKVDAVAYPSENLGRKNMHTSFKFKSTGYNQMEREKLEDVGCPRIRNSQLRSSDSDACSVGSCSVTDQIPNNLDIPSVPLLWRETDTVCSDAESYYGSFSEGKSSSLPPEEEVEVSIRRLELHAYRRTLEALYASGPLSWEQEAMLTNLRIMLHISNDEHLTELKNLISAKTAISFR